MSDVMLHGVLNMPPELWDNSEVDKLQRYSRYMQASRRIEDLDTLLNPRQWTKEMRDAWHSNLPDTIKAFEALRNVIQ